MGVTSRVEIQQEATATNPVAARGLGRHLGLSGRLFLLTVAFVALIEVLILSLIHI